MNRPLEALLCASFIAAAGGCAGPSGPPPGAAAAKAAVISPQAAQALVVAGRTTKADVEAALGQADTVRFDSGWDVWAYRWRGQQRTTRGDTELVILFGADGVVRKSRIRPPYPNDDS